MKAIYDSASFLVLHLQSCAAHHPGDCFEIVDKRNGMEVCLSNEWAATFRSLIDAWQANEPTQAEVDEALEAYAALAQNPVRLH